MLSRVSQETSRPIAAMAEASKTPESRVRQVASALAQCGYVTIEAQTVFVTESGRQVAASLEAAQEEGLNELLEGWAPHDHPDVEALVAEISKRLSSEDWAMAR
jgi:DNA-binding MarR family transcriptional regulator